MSKVAKSVGKQLSAYPFPSVRVPEVEGSTPKKVLDNELEIQAADSAEVKKLLNDLNNIIPS